MVLKDLSGLPAAQREDGHPPVADAQFVEAIAQSWYTKYIDDGNAYRSTAVEGLPYRASYAALRCDRQLFYAMKGVERPLPNIADAYRMSLGTLVHAGLEPAIKAAFPSAQFEVPVDLRTIGVDGSAHADIVTYHDDGKVDAVVEVKTVNGFGFKSMATNFKGPAQGPRSGHVLQAAMSALALDADRVVVAYLSMENLSPTMSKYGNGDVGRFAAEWHYPKSEYVPIASREVARLEQMRNMLELDIVPSTWVHDDGIPEFAYISDPSRGMWVLTDPHNPGTILDTGRVWFCDYCDFRERCKSEVEGTPVQVV